MQQKHEPDLRIWELFEMDHLKTVVVNVAIPIDIEASTGTDHIVKTLEESLNKSTWNEGRYDLSIECLEKAIVDVVRDRIQTTINDFFRTKYPNEMVKTETGGLVAKSYIETNKWMKQDLKDICGKIDRLKFSVWERFNK